MKQTTKRAAAILTLAALSAGMLSGCGEKKTNADGVTTVTVWTNSTHTKDVMTELVADYNETTGKEKGIKIDYVVQGGDYQKVLDVAIQSKEVPELYYPINGVREAIKQNVITALDDMPGGAEFIKKYDGKLVNVANVIDGKTYSVPYNLTTIGLLYNKDLFKKNGIVDENGEAKPPKTWDEVAEYAKKCTNPDAKEYGIALPLKWGGYFGWDLIQPFFSSLGTIGYDAENDCFNYSALLPAFQFLNRIKEDQSYYIGAEGLDNDPARAQFAEGSIAMKLGASWDVGVLNDQFPAKCDWGVAPVPTVTGQAEYKQWCSTDPFLVIGNVKDDMREKVMEVYKWFHDDKVVSKLYQKGKIIPADEKLIESTTLENPSKGWEEFCSFVSDSIGLPPAPSISLEGDSLSVVGMKIWMGEDAATLLKDLDERSAAALEKSVSDGKVNLADYKWSNIDIKAE